MNDEMKKDPADLESEILPDPGESSGIVTELDELGPGTVLFEARLARLLQRHPASIKRMVERGELPQPARMAGSNVWTWGAIVRHIEKRLEEAAKEAERMAQKLAKLSP